MTEPGLQICRFCRYFKACYMDTLYTLCRYNSKWPSLTGAGVARCFFIDSRLCIDTTTLILENAGIAHNQQTQNNSGNTSSSSQQDPNTTEADTAASTGDAVLPSTILNCCKDDALVSIETMKNQVKFEGKMKLGFRCRMHETMEKLGYEVLEREWLPRKVDLDSMKDLRARELEVAMPDFLNFRRRGKMDELDFD